MKLQITSASWNILALESFVRVTIMTEDGEVTILPGHESLLSAIRPGILSIESIGDGNSPVAVSYATSGWVLNISPEVCTIVADQIIDGESISDAEYIEQQKKQAEKMIEQFRQEHGDAPVDAKRLMELEYEMLTYTAMQELARQFHRDDASGARR